ncbi:MAG: lipopolysaccharide biosynthesis protein [Gemmatimonadetes bacterium]|nr:lipopolysaccharide biosynthesis protein [Gemmatimonadota bacterium]
MNDMQPEMVAAPGLSLVAIANLLLRRRRVLLSVATTTAMLTAIFSVVSQRTYTSESSFIIENKDGSGAAGLAAQLGVDVGGVDVTKSPDFYVGLLKTPDVLGRLADTSLVTSTEPKPRKLADIWEISETIPELRRDAVLKRLDRAITSSTGLKLDVVLVTVRTGDPLLSKQLAEAALAQVNLFNLKTRQSRASAERRFTESRMQELQAELTVAEQSLQRFYEVNRQQLLSPALEIEKGRLERKVALAQQTYGTLAQAFERSRIEEVRDTPLITVIRHPVVPLRPDPRGLVTKAILTFLLTLMGASVVVLILEAVRWMRASPGADALEFNRLVADTSRDVRRLRSVFSRVPGRPPKEGSLPS